MWRELVFTRHSPLGTQTLPPPQSTLQDATRSGFCTLDSRTLIHCTYGTTTRWHLGSLTALNRCSTVLVLGSGKTQHSCRLASFGDSGMPSAQEKEPCGSFSRGMQKQTLKQSDLWKSRWKMDPYSTLTDKPSEENRTTWEGLGLSMHSQ